MTDIGLLLAQTSTGQGTNPIEAGLVLLGIIYLYLRLGRRAERRARGRNIPTWVKKMALSKFYQEHYKDKANRTKRLRMSDFEFDHIVPFSEGGTHDPDNIRVVPKWENRRKGNKVDFEIDVHAVRPKRRRRKGF